MVYQNIKCSIDTRCYKLLDIGYLYVGFLYVLDHICTLDFILIPHRYGSIWISVLVDRGCVQPSSSSQFPWPLANVSRFPQLPLARAPISYSKFPAIDEQICWLRPAHGTGCNGNGSTISLVQLKLLDVVEWLRHLYFFIEFFMPTLETPRFHRISQFHGGGVEAIRVNACRG